MGKQDKKMKVSIIIPVYNVELFLSECVTSILQQTYKDFEVILVDDGSTDSSATICDSFALSDNRIRVIHKKNGGLSDARNVGLNEAKGEFVIFVDSDDFWAGVNSLENLIVEYEQTPDCDFIGFNYSYYMDSSKQVIKRPSYNSLLSIEKSSQNTIPLLIKDGIFPMSACCKIIRRSFLKENSIYFIKGILAEDIPWFMDLLFYSKKCRFINQYFYMYRKRSGGTISSSFSLKSFTDLMSILERGISDQRWNSSIRPYLLSFWAYEYSILLGMFYNLPVNVKSEFEPILLRYEWLFKYKFHPKVRKIALLKKFLGLKKTQRLLWLYLKKGLK